MSVDIPREEPTVPYRYASKSILSVMRSFLSIYSAFPFVLILQDADRLQLRGNSVQQISIVEGYISLLSKLHHDNAANHPLTIINPQNGAERLGLLGLITSNPTGIEKEKLMSLSNRDGTKPWKFVFVYCYLVDCLTDAVRGSLGYVGGN